MPRKSAKHSSLLGIRRRRRMQSAVAVPTGLDCIVRSKKSTPEVDQSLPPNLAQYGLFQRGYDYFNTALFNNSLPQVLITMQRDHRSYGYFADESFQNRGGNRTRIHEICLNPDGFVGRTDEDAFSTLVHEMAHVAQHEFGNPGRGRYHNREFARLMHSIGLMPSATGKPGGAETGDHMSHYILEGGPFAVACAEFLKTYRIVWESAAESASNATVTVDGEVGEGDMTITEPVRPGLAFRDKSKTKFVCPNGHGNAWAKPSMKLLCGDCYLETNEAVPMLPGLRNEAAGE
jgi:hypothetical protein